MKIGLLTSHRGQKQYEREHTAILSCLEKKGHEVVHSMDVSLEQLLPLGWLEREAIFMDFYKELEHCDIVFAESTVQSTQVGFGVSYLRAKGIPVVILTIRDVDAYSPKKNVYSNIENLMFVQYDLSDIQSVLQDALDYMEQQIDKRFTVVFPAHLLAQIDERVQKQKLPKSVYIRQLIEKDLQESKENK